jgi:hypothetical protein
MKVEIKTRVVVICSVCLVCLVLCGCYEQQSYFKNKKQYYISLEQLKDALNRSADKQEQIEYYAQMVDDALDYVRDYSTERIKKYIARGQLVVGMNQKEVIACLHTKDFRDGVPVVSEIYNSKYGKYETWIIGGSSTSTYSSYTPPKYALDFTYFILTGIHET